MQTPNFTRNATDFSAQCAVENGECEVLINSFKCYRKGSDHDAITDLMRQCGVVVIVPQRDDIVRFYLTSCQRMRDVTVRLFGEALGEFEEVTAPSSGEMSLGSVYRVDARMSIEDVRAKVEETFH